ncbi:MAG: thiolase family protein [Clostridiales Family XIII bacterium]|jgi:acetyl-CoA C-acetyltransferase|nr:thiolase family protein [Clostridiales Family XIII bacterium]
MREVVIVEGCRTAIGKIGGTMKTVLAEELARIVAQGVLDRSGINPAEIDEVIFGHARQSSDNPNIARLAGLRAGIPEDVPAYTVMRQCASGLTATNTGYNSIVTGECDVVLAGGTESMSTAPFHTRGARFGFGTGNTVLLDSVTEVQPQSQPQEIYGTFGMGMTAENVAEQFDVSREEQDKLAMRSQENAAAAIAAGRFKDEIIPVTIKQRKGDPIIFDTDEFPKQTSLEKLASLKPAFKEGGCVTPGNASGRNDGAAAVLIMARDKADELGLKPLARLVAFANAGTDPRIMGIGPVPATRKVLKRAGLTVQDLDLVELNEAFAAQAVYCIRELGLNPDIINVNGGAIALGHPIGCTGCRLVVTLVNEMQRRDNVKYGLVSMCIAGGMGSAAIIEKL